MTEKKHPLSSFEQWQLGELRQLVSERAAADPASAIRRPRPRLRLVTGMAGASLAVGAVVAVPLLLGDNGGPSAQAAPFEVEANDDGTVTARIYSYEDADGLEEQLESYGVAAEVDYTAEQRCDPDRGTEVDRPLDLAVDSRTGLDGQGPVSFTLRPSDFRPQETLILNLSWTSDPAFSYLGLQVIDGAVKPCVREDIPWEQRPPNDPS
jgi:hypothetical protein